MCGEPVADRADQYGQVGHSARADADRHLVARTDLIGEAAGVECRGHRRGQVVDPGDVHRLAHPKERGRQWYVEPDAVEFGVVEGHRAIIYPAVPAEVGNAAEPGAERRH